MGQRRTGTTSKESDCEPDGLRTRLPVPVVDIVVEDEGWQLIGGLDQLRNGIARAALRCGIAMAGRSVTLALSDDATVRELNARFRNQDKPTNVLSFPAAQPPGLAHAGGSTLGDIILARETVEREAAETGLTAADHACHLAVHGFLHLAGHVHDNEKDAETMEALESEILTGMGLADPYAADGPDATAGGRQGDCHHE